MRQCDTAIVGAGPYGLSIAAHLKARGVDFRIFGRPMEMWREHMPQGMRLKSEGFASSLFDPSSNFTLEHYCKQNGIPYARIGMPVPIEVFTSYALEFQRRFVAQLEPASVTYVEKARDGFRLRLENGEELESRRVIMAVGLRHYQHIPRPLSDLAEEFLTHSSCHSNLQGFRGKEVVVVGAGSSAFDLAALLHQSGASVEVLARRQFVHFHNPPKKRTLLDKLRRPFSGLGPGWNLVLCTNLPLVFRKMPEKFRLEKVKRVLGPAPGWFIKEQIVDKVPVTTGATISEIVVEGKRVKLSFSDSRGLQKTLVADHVIAATGYKVDLARLQFLDPNLRAQLKTVDHAPFLSSNFESSVPGLYFVGVSAANTFGPLLRFAFGAGFTARRLSKHLAKSAQETRASETYLSREPAA
jgi:thioredoxin reductase